MRGMLCASVYVVSQAVCVSFACGNRVTVFPASALQGRAPGRRRAFSADSRTSGDPQSKKPHIGCLSCSAFSRPCRFFLLGVCFLFLISPPHVAFPRACSTSFARRCGLSKGQREWEPVEFFESGGSGGLAFPPCIFLLVVLHPPLLLFSCALAQWLLVIMRSATRCLAALSPVVWSCKKNSSAAASTATSVVTVTEGL